MAVLKAFQALRPTAELAEKVAALPYDVMNSEEAREMVQGNPDSFLHIDKAEIDLDPSVDPYDPAVYNKAAQNLREFESKGIFEQDGAACLYVYKQVMDGRSQIGLVGCTSIDDYLNDIIKKHEFTRADKEQDRIKHVDTCDANTGPIFLTYRAQAEISDLIAGWITAHDAVYDFTSADGISHTVWVIDCGETIGKLESMFAGVESLYIADGHHRTASAAKVGQMRRAAKPDYDGTEEFNYFLSVLFPDDQLAIMDYNRVVQDLNGLTKEAFLQKVEQTYTVKEIGVTAYKPESRHTIGMFLEDTWYALTLKDGICDETDPVGRLDVALLQKHVLHGVLGIEDPRTDKRIDFIGGIRGLGELERRVRDGMAVAFAMYPTSIGELMEIADAGLVMPPKSTWFEPKLLSGLFIHKLS